jgi:hypothetical protein
VLLSHISPTQREIGLVFNDLKRLLKPDGLILSYWAAWAESEYRSIARSIFGGVSGGEPYALNTSCSDAVDFLKSSETNSAIGVILIAIGVEAEYRSVSRSP